MRDTRSDDVAGGLDQLLLALELEEGGHNPGVFMTHRIWKSQGKRVVLTSSRKEYNPADILI